jgi:hypothetical protein
VVETSATEWFGVSTAFFVLSVQAAGLSGVAPPETFQTIVELGIGISAPLTVGAAIGEKLVFPFLNNRGENQ